MDQRCKACTSICIVIHCICLVLLRDMLQLLLLQVNAHVVGDGTAFRLVAVRDIKEGEQVG